LALRISVHTGPVVVGQLGAGDHREHLAVGDTPNVAARVQTLAAANTVLITAPTWRIVQGYFACEPLGTHLLKGLADPTPLQRVLRFDRDDTLDARLTKLERVIQGYDFPPEKIVPLLAALLSVPLPEGRYPPLALTAQQQRQETGAALTSWLLQEAARQPVL